MYPGLTSWAKFSRPCGTQLGDRVLKHALWPLRYVHPIVGRELRHGVGFALQVSKSVPQRLLKPSCVHASYGTAEAVPFVRQSSPAFRVSESFLCCPNWSTEESNLDRCDLI